MAKQRFSLSDALDLFLLDREAQNLAGKTLKTYKLRLSRFVAWCADQSLTEVADLTSTHIRLYQAELVKTLADVTAKNRMVDVKTFLRFCIDERIIDTSPAERVKLPRVVERLPQVLSSDEVLRLHQACITDREKALLLVMLDTGARAEEVVNMDVADVSIVDGAISIREGKPRRDRTAYISPQTRKALLRYIKAEKVTAAALWLSEKGGGRLTESGLGQLIKRLSKLSGVKCTPHKIRKTFVTTMLRAGVDVFTLRKLSGHKSLEALKPYVAIADVDAEQAHRRNSPVTVLLK